MAQILKLFPLDKVDERWIFRPPKDVIAAEKVVARIRNSTSSVRGLSNLPTETASYEDHEKINFYACLAEVAGSMLLNVARTCVCKPGDDVYDIGYWIEVRSIQDMRKGLLLRSKDRRDPPFILVYVDPQTLTCYALGWAWGSEVFRKGFVIDQHTDKPAWVLAQKLLQPMEELARLVWGDADG